MSFMLIFRADEGLLSPAEFVEGLLSMQNISNVAEGGIGSLVIADFIFEDQIVIVRFKPDMQIVSISEESSAGLEFAVRMQIFCRHPLRIVDEAYSFDLHLKDYPSWEKLASAIASARSGAS